jgi:hypothetical protein
MHEGLRTVKEGRSFALSAKEHPLACCATGASHRYAAIRIKLRLCQTVPDDPWQIQSGEQNNDSKTTTPQPRDTRGAEAFRLRCGAMLVRGEAS